MSFTIPSYLAMVQRQRADPGGAVVHGVAGQDPDAPVLMAKSEDAPMAVEIVVDPIDTRHVVDEIRDHTSSRDRQKEAVADLIDLTAKEETSGTPTSMVEVPRASWFDVFDWKNIEQSSQTKLEANARDTEVDERVPVETEVVSPPVSPPEQGVEVPIRSRLPSATAAVISQAAAAVINQAAAARPVSPRPDRSVGRRVRDVIKSKTVVTSRDVLASRFERDMGRSPRSLMKEKGAEIGKPVVQARDIAAATVERFTRPSSMALSKFFQREPHAAPPKLVSEEFTSASVVSASDIKDKPNSRTPNAPRLLSEEFTADSIVSTSELQSMYFDPPSHKAPVRAARQVIVPAIALPNKETSLMDDLYSTWSDRAEATGPDESQKDAEPEPSVGEVHHVPVPVPVPEPAFTEVHHVPVPLTVATDDDDEDIDESPAVVAAPEPTPVQITDKVQTEVPDTSDEILEQVEGSERAPDACSCLGLDDEDFRPCLNAELPNPCQSKDVSHQNTDTTSPFNLCGNIEKMEDKDVANTSEYNPCKGVDALQRAVISSPPVFWCGSGDGKSEKNVAFTDPCGPSKDKEVSQKSEETDSRPFSWFTTNDEKAEDSIVTSDPSAEEAMSCKALSPRNMLESFFACIDPTYDVDKAPLVDVEKDTLSSVNVPESPEAKTHLTVETSAADESPESAPNATATPKEMASPVHASITSGALSPIATTADSSSPSTASTSSPATSPFSMALPSPLVAPVSSTLPNASYVAKTENPSSPVASSAAVSAGLAVAATLANGLSPMFGSSSSAKQTTSPISSPSRALSPREAVSPRETITSYDAVKDEDSVGGNLLDNDLDSVPSVTEDVEDSVAPMQADDLGPPSRPNMNSATLVENKVKKMKLPAEQMAANLDDASTVSTVIGLSNKPKIDPSLDARRRLLIKELRSNIATFGRYDVRCANISAALGDLLDEAKDYDHAVKLHKDAVTIYSCKLGDDHTTTLDARVRLGAVLENAGEVEEAINNYYQVTVMRRALHGDQDPSVGDGLVSMANALRKKGDYDQAIKELKRALKVFRESLGDSHAKVASTVDEIASLYVTIGNFDKSAAILEEVVKLKAATMGVKSKAVAGTLGQLATAYECSEKFAEAMKALKKSYKIYTEIGGYSNEDATTTLSRMAQLYEATNDHNRAAVAYLGVLRGRKIQRGADHLSVGETYFRLGRALRETKQFDKALKCHKEALPIFVGQGVEMNDVKMVAEIMHEMALISQDRGHFEDATRIFKQELSVRRKIGQPEFPFATRALKHLGINEYSLNNYSRALKHLVEALTIYKEQGDQGVECGEILYYTGLVFRKVGNGDRALDAFVEAVRIFTDHNVGDSDPLLRGANENIKSIEAGTK